MALLAMWGFVIAVCAGCAVVVMIVSTVVAIDRLRARRVRARIAQLCRTDEQPEISLSLDEWEVAQRRANTMLLQFLTPEQREEWRERQRVTVRGRRYDYRIRSDRQCVEVFNKNGTYRASAGYYPAGLSGRPANIPVPDRVLAQVMAVRHNLEDIERKACGVEGMTLR